MPTFGMTKAEKKPPTEGEKKTYETIPAGTYNAEIVEIKHQYVDHEIKHWAKWDEEINWSFRITDGKYEKRRFWADVQAEITDWEGCKLRLWLQEILGVNELPDGFEFDTDNLDMYKGLPCRIRVNQYWSKKNEEYRNGIDDVLAPTASQVTASQPALIEEPF